MQLMTHLNVANPAIILGFVVTISHSGPAWAAHATHIQESMRNPGSSFVAPVSLTNGSSAATTDLNERVPSLCPTTIIDRSYRLSAHLIGKSGAAPSSNFIEARQHSGNENSSPENGLQEPERTMAQNQAPGPDPVSPQNKPSPAPSSESQSKANQEVPHVDIEKYGLQSYKQRSPGPTNSHYVNSANGHQVDFYHDPDRNPFSNQNDSWLQVCNNTSHGGWTGGATGWSGTKDNCINQYEFNAAPGFSLGSTGVGPGGWSTHVGIHLNSIVNSPGISEMIYGNQVKAGIGDNTGFYFYNFSYGGAIAGSDEGNHLTAALGGEQNTVYTGNVTNGGPGVTSVKIRCSADCDFPGDGRYLIDTQRPVASGHVTAKTNPDGRFVPGTFTIDTAVAPSSAWGTLAADVATPIAAAIGTGFTNMTFGVNASHGRFTAGSLVCFGGMFHEQAVVSSVSGSGPFTLTVPLRHAHESGSWIMQGGPCGSFIEFTANSIPIANQTIRYPIDILGATDSHTLVYRYFAYGAGTFAGGYWAGNVTSAKLQANTLSNTNGTVTMTLAGGSPLQHPEFYNAASIYISNAASSSFNGICSNTRVTASGQLSCTQSSSNGAKSATAEASYGTSASGNTAFNLWSGAEVLDVLDESQSPPSVDGTLTVEPNSAAWAVNDSVENVHHYAARFDAQHLDVTINNPMKLSDAARSLALHGEGISGGNPVAPYYFAADHIMNYQPATNYAYHGGTVTPPGGIYLGGANGTGLFDYGLAMQFAPDPPGSSAVYIGCPVSGCGDGVFSYNFFTLAGNHAATTLSFAPATNTLSLNGRALNLKNEALIAPTIQNETPGAPASLGFAPIDSAGNAHAWALSAPPVGSGFTLTLPQANGTLALNNAFGASGANHSSGLVPDPGPYPGTARFLREDGKWVAIEQHQLSLGIPSVRPAVFRLNSDREDEARPAQPIFPAVVAHASLAHQNAITNLAEILNYTPEADGTFRLTVSVFIEATCKSGELIVSASLSPIAGHEVGQSQKLDCARPFAATTATITAHGAAGVAIEPKVQFGGADAGELRYMIDAILEQLQ